MNDSPYDVAFMAWSLGRYDNLKENCEGFDDPEERCPRHPHDCVCWKIRNVVEAGGQR